MVVNTIRSKQKYHTCLPFFEKVNLLKSQKAKQAEQEPQTNPEHTSLHSPQTQQETKPENPQTGQGGNRDCNKRHKRPQHQLRTEKKRKKHYSKLQSTLSKRELEAFLARLSAKEFVILEL